MPVFDQTVRASLAKDTANDEETLELRFSADLRQRPIYRKLGVVQDFDDMRSPDFTVQRGYSAGGTSSVPAFGVVFQ